MDRQGFPVLYVEKLSKKACNISVTGMNLELLGKILELEWIWNWTKFDFRLGEWNWTSSNFDLEDRNGSRSKKYGPVTMYAHNLSIGTFDYQCPVQQKMIKAYTRPFRLTLMTPGQHVSLEWHVWAGSKWCKVIPSLSRKLHVWVGSENP